MARIQLPENWQQALAGEGRLPERLDELRAAAYDARPEGLAQHPLPGIELEQLLDRRTLQIDEAVVARIQADIFDIQLQRCPSRLGHRIHQVGRAHPVLLTV